MNLNTLCGYLRNYFERDIKHGHYVISGGVIGGDVSPLVGQYIRIVGSVLNDGVYKWTGGTIEGLTDEEFDGSVWLLAIPKEVVDLAAEIGEWQTKYQDAVNSPFSSESLSASSYSYSKASGGSDGVRTWQDTFSKQLSQWRKI